ncbi:Aegerolysin aa-Pri1 [Cerioporus squamosus]|nr:Aegerolysin aa-Pri1 [Cerioporus squamosus]
MSETNDAPRPPHAYGQWVTMYLKNSGSKDIKVVNLSHSWGKMYADGNKDQELSVDTFNGHVIAPGGELQMNACGRQNASSGTRGDFDVVDVTAGDMIIRHFHWDCPWGSHANQWTVSQNNSNWMVESKGANYYGGALGTVFVEFLNKPV